METITFNDLYLSRELRRGITEMGYKEPTDIQQKAIPIIQEGKDIIGQAQTGTGKTAAFGIPLLDSINARSKKTQAMILCPTRELANQVADELTKISKYLEGINVVPIYGGKPIGQQIRDIKKGAHIIVGTPGRIIDHIERRTLRMDSIEIMILDEADEMLNMGFREDIERILDNAPVERQTLLFSATMPKPILRLTKEYQQNPEHINVVKRELTAPKVEQFYIEMKGSEKADAVRRIIEANNFKSSLIFCNTKREVDTLLVKLKAHGHSVEALHGDIKQAQREITMKRLRDEKINVLVATDVAARGLDVENIEVVFNYDLPHEIETYVHRIGRTARAGRPGVAYSFVSRRETGKLRAIKKYTKTEIISARVPSYKDIEKIKDAQIADAVRQTLKAGQLDKYDSWVEQLAESDEYNYKDIAAALAKMILRDGKKNKY
ncbi:DEAD/DEAH box helicase [Methanolobus sp. ZRKC3]|uniref:DEAD/DEAH box helicase n=1 Tax=Methanolobus sp. ZRKC3 TaxID=3125786 RepID=UPI00324C4CA0